MAQRFNAWPLAESPSRATAAQVLLVAAALMPERQPAAPGVTKKQKLQPMLPRKRLQEIAQAALNKGEQGSKGAGEQG